MFVLVEICLVLCLGVEVLKVEVKRAWKQQPSHLSPARLKPIKTSEGFRLHHTAES